MESVSPVRPRALTSVSLNYSSIAKKTRTSTPYNRKTAPPRPSKTLPSVSRFFSQPLSDNKPHAISFKKKSKPSCDSEGDVYENDSLILLKSDGYDESRQESYFEQVFDVEGKIGSGYFGDVFRVRSKIDHRYYAVKRFREQFRGRGDRERRLQEVAKHEQLPKHPNLVEFFRAWEERQRLYIQTELCDQTLADFSQKCHDIPEEVIWKILTDLLMAIQHLHENELIHLDIKPENVFISNGICKLGDFGLVVDLSRMQPGDAIEGDPKYMAKELMSGQFTKAADIFSIGITILELACDLELPSGGDGFHSLRSGDIPFHEFGSHLSDDLKEVITSMMDPVPEMRPSASDLLKHPFIRKIAKKRVWNIAFVEIAKKMRNFFQLLLHYLSLVFFVDYFHSAISNTAANTPRNESFGGPYFNDSPDSTFHGKIPPLTFESDDEDLTPTDAINTSFSYIGSDSIHTTGRRPGGSCLRDRPTPPSPIVPKDTIRKRAVSEGDGRRLLSEAYQRGSIWELSDNEEEIDTSEPSIGPKNLLAVFDQIEEEEQELHGSGDHGDSF